MTIVEKLVSSYCGYKKNDPITKKVQVTRTNKCAKYDDNSGKWNNNNGQTIAERNQQGTIETNREINTQQDNYLIPSHQLFDNKNESRGNR
ncbi:19323_t:CDS:2 [Gigaspora margarita]|uniref:19323_t:CDS:1 n=1 Tax=Gigaspora margarita TaxID=4874 RepID=A0ABM8W5D9_GIGMA|nr:19323_t:CDS:2 [Gigaspora margarita]